MIIVTNDNVPILLIFFFVYVGVSYNYWRCSNEIDRRRNQSAWKEREVDYGLFSFLAEV